MVCLLKKKIGWVKLDRWNQVKLCKLKISYKKLDEKINWKMLCGWKISG